MNCFKWTISNKINFVFIIKIDEAPRKVLSSSVETLDLNSAHVEAQFSSFGRN